MGRIDTLPFCVRKEIIEASIASIKKSTKTAKIIFTFLQNCLKEHTTPEFMNLLAHSLAVVAEYQNELLTDVLDFMSELVEDCPKESTLVVLNEISKLLLRHENP